jgi:hypothetical protein
VLLCDYNRSRVTRSATRFIPRHSTGVSSHCSELAGRHGVGLPVAHAQHDRAGQYGRGDRTRGGAALTAILLLFGLMSAEIGTGPTPHTSSVSQQLPDQS